jgi:uncharacterized GH25 family protein
MRINFKRHTLALAALALACTLPAHAHRTWLLPSSTQVESREAWVTVDAAVSENLFDFDTNVLKLDGLRVLGPDGAPVNPEYAFSGRLRSSFDLRLAKPGTYRISLVTEPIMASYKLNGEVKRWRGTEETMAKEVPANADDLHVTRMHNRVETFVSAGKPNDTALKTTGVGLELVPITHPNELSVGEKARFRFLLDGKPAAAMVLSVVPGGVRYRGVLKEITVTTDAKGEFSVSWPEAGMYWVSASYPPRPPVVEGAPPAPQPSRRLSYSGTLEVLPQ